MVPSAGDKVNDFLQTQLDDRALLDLVEPRFLSRVELLPEQDVADLLSRAHQPLALQCLLRFEPEDVPAERGPIGGRDLARSEGEDLGLDVLRELTALQRAQITALLSAGIAGEGLGQLDEVPAFEDLRAQSVGAPSRVGPRVLRCRVLGLDEDVPGVIAEADL